MILTNRTFASDQLESKQRVVQERDAAIKQLNLVIHDKDYAAEQQNRQLRILTNDVALVWPKKEQEEDMKLK